MTTSETIDGAAILDELAQRLQDGRDRPARRVVLFAGAALSMARPSYLPPAAPLVRAVLETLVRGRSVAATLGAAGASPGALVDAIVAKGLVPEALYQHVREVAGLGKLVDLLRILGEGRPNANHHLAACLGRAGFLRLILTTNFDDLLERAFAQIGQRVDVQVGREVDVDRVRATFESTSDSGAVVIWKIHGDIGDALDPSRHERIVTTLGQIGPAPSREIAAGLEAALKGRAVLFLGYSANDHDLAGKIAELEFERLFWNSLSTDPSAHRSIARIMELRATAARWLVGDINVTLGLLARRLGMFEDAARGDPGAFQPIAADEWQREIVDATRRKVGAWDDDAARRVDEPRKVLILATILRLIGAPAEAAAIGRAALALDAAIPGEIQFELGRASVTLGLPDEAERHFRAALEAFQRGGRIGAQTFPLVELAGLASMAGDRASAFDYARQALELAQRAHVPTTEANAWKELADQYHVAGDLDRAEASAKRARSLYAQTGSVDGEASSLALLGLLAEGRGRLADAEANYRQSLELARLAGQARSEATALNRIGEVRRQQGQFAEALGFYEQAGALYRRINDPDGEGAILNNIGIVFRELKLPDRAEAVLRRSIEIHRRIRDLEGEAQSWLNLGNVSLDRKDWNGAADAYTRASNLFQSSGNVRGLAMVQTNLGATLLYGRHDVPGAIGLYQNAAALYAQASDLRSEGGIALTLGFLHEQIRHFHEAAGWYEHARSRYEQLGDEAGAAKAQAALAALPRR